MTVNHVWFCIGKHGLAAEGRKEGRQEGRQYLSDTVLGAFCLHVVRIATQQRRPRILDTFVCLFPYLLSLSSPKKTARLCLGSNLSNVRILTCRENGSVCSQVLSSRYLK